MTHSINQVFKFVSQRPAYKATIGVVHSEQAGNSIVLWGAYNPVSEEYWVPELESIRQSWHDAQWTPMSVQQDSQFEAAYNNERQQRQDWLHSI